MDKNLRVEENRTLAMEELGWTPLHYVVEKQDIASVRQLLRHGDINATDNFNRTPLSIAASKDNLELVQILTEGGADVNEGFPLHFACEKGHSANVTYLIEHGSDVNLEREKNYPLLIASGKGDLETAKILIEHGADVNVVDENQESALHWACDSGKEDLISFLIDCGCDMESTDKYGLTPLSICLIRKENDPELVKLLLMKGASIGTVDDQDYTYLHSAEHPESVLELIKYGVNVDTQNAYGETPLYSLTLYRHLDGARALLQNNADPNIPASGGWTPLHCAAAEGYLEYVEDLLESRADVNVTSAQNITPLHLAAYNGHTEIVKRLLQQGSLINNPVINLPDVNSLIPHYAKPECISNGLTPLDLAASNGHTDIYNLLASKETDDWPCSNLFRIITTNDLDALRRVSQDENLEPEDLLGWTPLHYAVEKGYYDMCRELINRGVSVNVLDKYKRTPLCVAAARNNVRILDLLIDNGADVNLGLPLFYAVEEDSIECVKRLITVRSCDVNIKNDTDSKTPILVQAASNSKSAIVKLLLGHNADPNSTDKWGESALHNACRFGDFESVKALIQNKADVNKPDSCNETPILLAAMESNLDIINLLLEHKADVKASNKFKTTVLHNARFETIADRLAQAGASVNACNDEGETPLFTAAGDAKLLKTLIEHRADVNYRSPGGWTPLHESAVYESVECVQELLKNGAIVNAASAENVLPIYLATVHGNTEVVKELLDNGSYVDPYILDIGVIRDDSGVSPLCERYHIVAGNTPLIGAASKGLLEVVKVLHLHGAALDAVNLDGNTALHEAVLNGSAEVVKFLLGANVDLNVKNKSNKTAFDLAKELSRVDICQMIKNHN